MGESDTPGELDDDEPSEQQPPAKRSLRRFAGSLGDTYRSLHPDVAQMITAPGVLPRRPEPDS